MKIEVHLTHQPIPTAFEAAPGDLSGGVGAWVEFRGLVRDRENDCPIRALEYEAYSPMAERQMRRILEALSLHHPCEWVRVVHRIGVVPAGEAAIYVGVGAKHREPAFRMLAGFMDRLKQDVPIWKTRAVAASDAGGSGGNALQGTACAPNPG